MTLADSSRSHAGTVNPIGSSSARWPPMTCLANALTRFLYAVSGRSEVARFSCAHHQRGGRSERLVGAGTVVPGVRPDPGDLAEPVPQQPRRRAGPGHGDDVDVLGLDRRTPAPHDLGRLLLTPEAAAGIAALLEGADVFVPGPGTPVLDRLLPHGRDAAPEVTHGDGHSDLRAGEGVAEHLDPWGSHRGEVLHGDDCGAVVRADLVDEGVPGAGLALVGPEQIGDGAHVAVPGRAGEQDLLPRKSLAVGVEPTLEERRPGLHQADVEDHPLCHTRRCPCPFRHRSVFDTLSPPLGAQSASQRCGQNQPKLQALRHRGSATAGTVTPERTMG